MGLFGSKEEKPQQAASVAEKKAAEGTVICEGMTFVGDFETDEQMDIKGIVRGEIVSSVDTHICETGLHMGNIFTNTLHCDGKMESEVECKDLASLSETSEFKGVLRTANVDLAHGSTFMGTLTLKHDAPAEKSLE